MDKLTQHRKTRLRALVEGKPYFGNQADLARAAAVTKARITQLLDPDEPFGERAADNLCLKLHLPPRWFEQEFTTGEGEMVPADRASLAQANPPLNDPLRMNALLTELQAIVDELAPILQEPARMALLKWTQGQASVHETTAILRAYQQASKALPAAMPTALVETPGRRPAVDRD